LLADIARTAGVPCRLAGGISSLAKAEDAIAAGFAGVLFSSAVFGDDILLRRVARLGDRAIVEIEAARGALAPRGGDADLVRRASGRDALDAAEIAALRGIRALYVIDLSTERQLGGPPLVLMLEAVLASLGKVDALWVTGDTVGYGPDPGDTLALLRERGALLVQGNHDRAVATGEGLEFFHDRAAEAALLHQKWLSSEDRDALAALPTVATADRFTLCHGSLRDPLWEYVTTTRAATATLQLAATDHCCNGHTHIPAFFSLTATG